MTQLDVSSATFLVNASHAGIRIGPRVSLLNQGLSDWMVSPFVLGGLTRILAGDYGPSWYCELVARLVAGGFGTRLHLISA